MPGSALLPLRVAILAGLLLTAAAHALPAQERVGVNVAVNPQATGTAPGASPRRLVIGQDVLFNEHITTTEGGQTQLLFVDESSMTVGPNSDLTIDQFVYDPKTGTGKLTMSATRGLLRYVGGKLSKEDDAVTLRTATATLAVRGGAFIAQIDSDGKTEAAFIYGKGLTVTGTTGVAETLIRPGFAVTVSGPGAAPSRPAPMPPGQLALFTQRLDGIAGRTGGAKTVPTDATVAASGVSQTVSGNLTASVQQATQNQGTSQFAPQLTAVPTTVTSTLQSTTQQGATTSSTTVPPPGVGGGFINSQSNTGAGFTGSLSPYSGGNISNGTFSVDGSFGQVTFPLAAGGVVLPASGAGTTSPFGPVTGTTYLSPDQSFFYANLTPVNSPSQTEFIYGGTPVSQSFYQATSSAPTVTAFIVNPDAALQSSIPFITQATGGSLSNASVSPLFLATPADSTFSTPDNGTVKTKALQASLAIDGAGAQQSSAIVVLVGNVLNNPQPNLEGVIHSSYLSSGTSQPIRNISYYATPTDGNGNSFYGANAISGFVLSPGAGASNAISVNTATQATTSYQFNQPLTATALPAVASGTQTTQTLTGFFGGIMTEETKTPTGPTALEAPISYILAGQTSISTNASNLQLSATQTGGDPFTSSTSGIPANNGMVLQFGSLPTGNTNARQAFINDNLFAAFESPTANSTVNGVTVPYSNTNFPNTNPNIYMVTQTAAPPTSLLPNGACACQFLQWGYWGGEIDTPASGSTPARTDVGNVNFWVAGVPTSVGDLNTLAAQAATGTYTGAAIGTVFNNGSTYLASGGFTGTYSFGTQSGSFTVSNFDGHTISSTGKAPLTGANYSFSVAQPGVAGLINGTFYGPMAAETGGNFAFHATTGPTYLASGIFAGKR
jgi:trimeric autotransporter adhesin